MTQATPASAPAHRSYSQLSTLRNCGEQYRLTRVEKIAERPSVPAVVGRVIHTATEFIDHALLADPSVDPTTEALSVADRELDAAVQVEAVHNPEFADPDSWKRYGRATVEKPRGEDLDWFRDHGIPAAILAYYEWRQASGLELLDIPGFGPAIEVPFELYIGDQLIQGFIDRIFQRDGTPCLTDLKSGLKPKTSEQLGIYRHAVLRGLGLDIQYGVYVYALKTGTAKITPPIDLRWWTEERLARIYVDGSKLIEQGIYLPAPGDNCFRCGVAYACDFSQAAI